MSILIGLTGMTLILLAFLLDELGKLSQKDKSYQVMNILGSGLLAWYAILLGSWPFLILNIVWCAVALWRLARG